MEPVTEIAVSVEEDEREQKEQRKAAEAQKGKANPVCFLDIEAPTVRRRCHGDLPWWSLRDGSIYLAMGSCAILNPWDKVVKPINVWKLLFFPTLTCGVFVFSSVSAPLLPPPPVLLPSYSLSLTHSHSLTHSVTHSLTHSFTHLCMHIHTHTQKLTHHHPSITLILPLPFLLFYAQSKPREVGNMWALMWGYPVL